MNTRNFGSLFYTINFNYARRMAFIRQTIRYECEMRWRIESERKIKMEMSNRTKKNSKKIMPFVFKYLSIIQIVNIS